MKKQYFIITYLDDNPYYSYEKILAVDKDEALDIFEATISSRDSVLIIETELDWVSKNE